MKICTKCKINKELSEFNKRTDTKDKLRTECKLCGRLVANKRNALHPDRAASINRLDRKLNPEKIRIRNLKYKLKNPGKKVADNAAKRAAKKQRTPKWLTKEDFDKMKEFYKLANILTNQTGIKHHVDHIIPLHGKTVSGLHVPSNLRVITAQENLSKNNKLIEIEKDQQADPL